MTTTITTAPSPAATITALLALTTQYAQPPECATIRDLTTVSSLTTTYDLINNTNTHFVSTKTWPAVVSDPGDQRFASCQPPGWAAVVTESRFHFSPAVCPRGWTANEVSVVTTSGRTVTEAYCCSASHHINTPHELFPVSDIPVMCVQTWTAKTETSDSIGGSTRTITETMTATESRGDGATITKPFTRGLHIHPAWKVSWEAKDMSTLSPQPPASLPRSGYIPYFVPGQDPPQSFYQDDINADGERRLGQQTAAYFFGLAVGLPVGIVLLIGICCCWCFCPCSRGRRKAKTQNKSGVVQVRPRGEDAEAAPVAAAHASARDKTADDGVSCPPPAYSPADPDVSRAMAANGTLAAPTKFSDTTGVQLRENGRSAEHAGSAV